MKPIIFLAFANDKVDNARYLRNLPRELDGIRNALYEAQEAGLCEVVERANITLEQIFDIFQSKNMKIELRFFTTAVMLMAINFFWKIIIINHFNHW